MAFRLPTKRKRWTIAQTSHATSGVAVTDLAEALLLIHQAMVACGWSIAAISDSVAVAVDGSDLWLTSANIVPAAPPVAHSWVVWQHPTRLTQVCVDCDAPLLATLGMHCSPAAGFTGGLITARPTAIDEFPIYNVAGELIPWAGNGAAPFTAWVVSMQRSDDAATRVLLFSDAGGLGQVAVGCWFFEQLDQFIGNDWSGEIVGVMAHAADTSVLDHVYQNVGAAQTFCKGIDNAATEFDIVGTSLEYAGNVFHTSPAGDAFGHDMSGSAYPFIPIGLVDHNGGGFLGVLTDWFWGNDGAVVTLGDGVTFPDNASVRAWVQSAEMIFPWTEDTTVPWTSAGNTGIGYDVDLGALDRTAPAPSNFSPANGSAIDDADPIYFDVTDDSGQLSVLVFVEQTGVTELAWDGPAASFVSPYLLSNVQNIALGYRFTLRRSGGWVDTVTVSIRAVDPWGNQYA